MLFWDVVILLSDGIPRWFLRICGEAVREGSNGEVKARWRFTVWKGASFLSWGRKGRCGGDFSSVLTFRGSIPLLVNATLALALKSTICFSMP